MKKRQIIPPLPEPFVLTEELEANLKGWIQYLKNMSPRVAVRSHFDADFRPDYFKEKFKACFDVDDDLSHIDIPYPHWPQDGQIAFIAFFDSSLPGEKKKNYMTKDAFVFCYGDIAFSASDFEQNEDAHKAAGIYFVYERTDWGNPDICSWNGKAEILQTLLIDLEKSVPKVKIRPH